MKRTLKRTIASLTPARANPGFRVLLYHAIAEPEASDTLRLRVSPATFRQQIQSLRAEGYRITPLQALLDGPPPSGRCVAITFDDGYASQLAAADALEELGMPATFFVVVDTLGGTRLDDGYWGAWPGMAWSDVMDLAKRGFEIGAHSASHRRLTRCGPVEREREIAGAKARLEDRLGERVTSFSYPHGAYDAQVRDAVAAAGYRLACTSVCGGNAGRSPLELRRLDIGTADDLRDVRDKLAGRYDWLGGWHRWRARHA